MHCSGAIVKGQRGTAAERFVCFASLCTLMLAGVIAKVHGEGNSASYNLQYISSFCIFMGTNLCFPEFWRLKDIKV